MFEITGTLVVNDNGVISKQTIKLGFIPGKTTCCHKFNWRFADCLMDNLCIYNGIIRGEFMDFNASMSMMEKYTGTVIAYALDEEYIEFRLNDKNSVDIEIRKQDKSILINNCLFNGNVSFNGITMNAAPIIIKHAPKIYNEIDKNFIIADEVVNSFFSTKAMIEKARAFAKENLSGTLPSGEPIVFSSTFSGNLIPAMCCADVLAIYMRYETKLIKPIPFDLPPEKKNDLELTMSLNNSLRKCISEYISDKSICYLNIRKEDVPDNVKPSNEIGHHFDIIRQPIFVESDKYAGSAIPIAGNPTQEIVNNVGEIMNYVMKVKVDEISIDEVPSEYRDLVKEMIDISEDKNSFCLGLAYDPTSKKMVPLTRERLETLHRLGIVDENTYQTAQQLMNELGAIDQNDDNYYEEDDDYADADD